MAAVLAPLHSGKAYVVASSRTDGKGGEDCRRELFSVCVAYCPADLVLHLTEQGEAKRESLGSQDLHPSVSSPHWVWEGLRAQIWSVARAPENTGAGGLAPLTPSHIVSPMVE